MGGEPSKTDSNISKADSEFSNSGTQDILETMDCLKENEDTLINRVWIAKKAITSTDRHVSTSEVKYIGMKPCIRYSYSFNTNGQMQLNIIPSLEPEFGSYKLPIELIKPKKNIFKIKKTFKCRFKHWAIILELTNRSFVNIQFGRTGFSLKEFNKTYVDGENILKSLLEIWGEEDSPLSFCYIGKANYEYDKLKNFLYAIKKKEKEDFENKKSVYYNLSFRNCQHFACDIEKILFGNINTFHSFDYYIDEFFETFFYEVNMNILQLKYEKDLKQQNEELFKSNIKTIEEYLNKNSYSEKNYQLVQDQKKRLESWFSLKYDDYLLSIKNK